MPLPKIPSQAEMRIRCRNTYGHYSNISRQKLQAMTLSDRIAKFEPLGGSPEANWINRINAELWEAEWLAKTDLEVEADLDWYITRYQIAPPIPGPNGDYAKWGMMGLSCGRVRFDVCPCSFHVVETVPGLGDYQHLRTWTKGPEHSAGSGQPHFDAVNSEQARKNGAINMLANLQSTDTSVAQEQVLWTFDNATRLTDGLSRFLHLSISDITVAEQTSLQGLVDVRFGPNTVLVERR